MFSYQPDALHHGVIRYKVNRDPRIERCGNFCFGEKKTGTPKLFETFLAKSLYIPFRKEYNFTKIKNLLRRMYRSGDGVWGQFCRGRPGMFLVDKLQ